jgi:putative ATPase
MPNSPLANILRPHKLTDVIGQRHLIGETGPLKRMVDKGVYQSCILWGPPGVGKTSIVRAMANERGAAFHKLNATESTVKDLRKVISSATKDDSPTFVFVDEIHRWSVAQQDVMLPVVEDGTIILFGATTEKPKFAVNSTILSRCLVLEVKPLNNQDMVFLIKRVIEHYKSTGVNAKISPAAAKRLIMRCSGDARKAITVLETAVCILTDDGKVEEEHINVAMPDKHIVFDSSGNDHYDLAHCFQEAIQHSKGDEAIYWLAKWLSSGEDPAYICRRMLITAFEDCAGNPNAWLAATAACYAVERTGMPECMIPMALATCEMANSERNKSAYYAIKQAMDDVANGQTIHVPENLRAGTSGYEDIVNRKYIHNWRRDA